MTLPPDFPIKKVLIANRGEIAVRILRSCRDLGIDTVAVYSDADRNALHVRFANEAYPLGGNTPAESYLRGDAILKIALDSGADAIHPGFGFLAENGDFAESVEAAGLRFIGPSSHAMAVMGDKLASRKAMVAAGVPVVPGGTDAVKDAKAAAEAALEIGYPVMLKASAGGGGKGIRVVESPDEIETAFTTASGEAQNAFGDGRMYVEKYLVEPRHIEIQVLGDKFGNVLHFGERECSLQRRHQKLIEEAPSPAIDEATRQKMGAAAVAAAKAVDYVSAGTVEFLWSRGDFYFLEMNTRIQVEHGITEEVYGIDLITQMIRVAGDERIDDCVGMIPRGHAIEVRLNAEDPENNFLPSLGTIRNLRWPGGPGVRIDSSVYRGMEVTPYYDSMLAKLIAYGRDREQARRRMLRILQELHVGGVKTSAGVALQLLQTKGFREGNYDTGFLERYMEDNDGQDVARDLPDDLEEIAVIVATIYRQRAGARRHIKPTTDGHATNPWVAQARREQHGGKVQ
ncbi:MAG: acetyl-CoA carboxylase biotin carboxylase subunit [Planctomycetota bacterium]|jgi:acetyl-CoA carboxylase biotin carboxylase subunit|nr:acetyl-CoA carboxylase biotin carboxylase subunit [Planctomycetota bacterium]